MARAATQEDEALWTINDLAAYLRTSPTVAYKLYRRHEIPRLRVGRRLMFSPSEVKRWAKARVEKGT